MTQEEILKEAERLYKTANADQMYVLESLFPELRESEDERIRKEIISALKYANHKGVYDKHIAWLEKQGEQKPAKNIVETWKDMRLEVYQQASGNRHEPNYSDDNTKMFSLNDIDEIIEKMSEQKSSDKVEPKFHEGEWVVNKLGDVWHIDSFDKKNYQVSDGKGNYNYFPISKQDEMNLWSIKDAKDGDVLTYKNDEVEWIFIYREIVPSASEVPHDLLRYYTLLEGNYFNWNGVSAMVTDDYELYLKPATKEQRDTLKKAMDNAGWKFDLEKKELKNIEQPKLTEFEDAIKEMMDVYRDAIDVNDATVEEVKKHAAYLLSLIPQKPAWSEEDKVMLDEIIDFFENRTVKLQHDLSLYASWLKSLKERRAWKPSDEQMDVLETAVSSLQSNTLETLYQDLMREKNYE